MSKVIKLKNEVDSSIKIPKMSAGEKAEIYWERGQSYHVMACGLEEELHELELGVLEKKTELEKCFSDAFRYFEKAARLNHYYACNNLATYYDCGYGKINEDLDLGKFWRAKAKEIGKTQQHSEAK